VQEASELLQDTCLRILAELGVIWRERGMERKLEKRVVCEGWREGF